MFVYSMCTVDVCVVCTTEETEVCVFVYSMCSTVDVTVCVVCTTEETEVCVCLCTVCVQLMCVQSVPQKRQRVVCVCVQYVYS